MSLARATGMMYLKKCWKMLTLGKGVHLILVFFLLMVVVGPGSAEIYKWVDDNGQVHFSDRKDNRIEQEIVRVKPAGSKWSRYEIEIDAVGVALTDDERRQIADSVNNVYEFFDRVMAFDMYQTVPVNIRIFPGKAEYRNYLISKNKGMPLASYGLYIPSENRIAVYMREDRSRTFTTIRHEVTHAVIDTIVPYAPAWLHEGLAEQMEMLGRDDEGLYIEHHRQNRRVVEQAYKQGRLADIDQFLKLPSNTWQHADRSGTTSLRAQASQFVYFLLSKPTGRDFLVRLLHNFDRGDRTLSYYLVNENYIGGVAMLEVDWSRWLRHQSKAMIRL